MGFQTFSFQTPPKGVRLFLKKTREDTDVELIQRMTRRSLTPEEDVAKGPKFLAYFEIEKALNLIGGERSDLTLDWFASAVNEPESDNWEESPWTDCA